VLNGVMTLWFLGVAASVVFVAVDIRRTPESAVLKWGFVVVTAYSGPLGALLYVLSCREPLPNTHLEYVRARWRQVTGSTMHCVAGDGLGILFAAAVTSRLGLPTWADLLAEYAVGFLFGWTIFQALFMRSMAGGDYRRSLRMTFLPELVSMNAVMAGMAALSIPWLQHLMRPGPTHPSFWFVMSVALTLGFVVAYPMNWWLVAAGLKHGMVTVQPDGAPAPLAAGLVLAGAALSPPGAPPATPHPGDHVGATEGHTTEPGGSDQPTRRDTRSATAGKGAAGTRGHGPRLDKVWMTTLSFAILGAGVAVAGTLGSLGR
jgi:hypothetical protein